MLQVSSGCTVPFSATLGIALNIMLMQLVGRDSEISLSSRITQPQQQTVAVGRDPHVHQLGQIDSDGFGQMLFPTVAMAIVRSFPFEHSASGVSPL